MNEKNLREKQRKEFVRKCLQRYYEVDKTILIDPSVCNVSIAQYILKDLLYFGNKLLVLKEDLATLKEFARDTDGNTQIGIRGRNALSILKLLIKKKASVVSFEDEVKTRVDKIERVLNKYSNSLFYLENELLFYELRERGVMQQLYLMYQGMQDICLFKSKFTFETIGAITLKNGCMQIIQREMQSDSKIQVFNSKCQRKDGEVVDVSKRDYIVITTVKEDNVKSVKLYEVVSNHTKNNASLIMWTHLREGEKNEYIEALPYNFQEILTNI